MRSQKLPCFKLKFVLIKEIPICQGISLLSDTRRMTVPPATHQWGSHLLESAGQTSHLFTVLFVVMSLLLPPLYPSVFLSISSEFEVISWKFTHFLGYLAWMPEAYILVSLHLLFSCFSSFWFRCPFQLRTILIEGQGKIIFSYYSKWGSKTFF